jgi:hypothetical protein
VRPIRPERTLVVTEGLGCGCGGEQCCTGVGLRNVRQKCLRGSGPCGLRNLAVGKNRRVGFACRDGPTETCGEQRSDARSTDTAREGILVEVAAAFSSRWDRDLASVDAFGETRSLVIAEEH